jgi:hypothetical protein
MIVFLSEYWSCDYLVPDAPGESWAFADISDAKTTCLTDRELEYLLGFDLVLIKKLCR